MESLLTKVNALRVHSVWGSERDSNGRFPRWVLAALEGVDRLKQYVSFTLNQWDCINPLGFAKTNKSVVKSPFDLIETSPTHNVYTQLVFGMLMKAKSLFYLSPIHDL